MKIASLDLGSNTFLMLIAHWDGSNLKEVVADEVQVVRLAEGLASSGKLGRAALSRAEGCLKDFAQKIKEHRVERVIAVTTSAARDASNRDEFFTMGQRYGIPISLLSGEEEALATYLGVTLGETVGRGSVVVDVGGGSTEVIGASSSQAPQGISIDVGAVRMTERFLPHHPCPRDDIDKMERFIQDAINQVKDQLPQGAREVIAVAGTPTSLVTLELGSRFVESDVEGFNMPISLIWQWRDKLAHMSVAEREALSGMPRGRSDVLVAGATILGLTIKALGASGVKVSTRGVRYGLVPMVLKREEFQR